MKIVLDNNVFISGIFWKGPSHKIIALAEENKIEIFVTSEIFNELIDVLQREKFKPFLEEGKTTIEELSIKILGLIKFCMPNEKVKVIKEDPDDNKFLACAEACQASFVISGDGHLLKVKEFKGIPLIAPRKFLEICEKDWEVAKKIKMEDGVKKKRRANRG